jgi:hypothetical protein
MAKINWNLLFESIKLPLRLIVLAILPFLVTYLTELNTEWAVTATTILIVLDKYLHELWKLEEDKGLKKENTKPIGIVPF